MNKQQVLEKIKEDEFNTLCAPANYLNCVGWSYGFMRMRKYYKEFFKYTIFSTKKDIGFQHSHLKQTYNNLKQLYDYPEKTRKMIKGWLKKVKVYYEKSEQITKNLKDLEKTELIKKYEEYFEMTIDTWAEPLATDSIGVYTEADLIDDFMKSLPEKEEKNGPEYFAVLCQPSEISYTTKEHIDLLKLTVLSKENDKSFEKELKKHKQRYFWIEINYKDIKLLEEEYFLSKIKEESKKSKEDIEIEIKKLSDMKIIKKKQEEILKKISIPEKIKQDIELTQELGTWQDYRKEFNQKSNYFLSLFAKEFSKRLNCNIDDLYYISPDELKGIILDGNEIPDEIIKQRKEKMVQVMEQPEKETLFQGKDAEDIIAALERKEKERNDEIKEIKGNIASLGSEKTYKGVCKIVLNPSRANFNEGEILVASMTRPEYVPLMKKAKAIITDEGGITSHAAIVSRELGIPCIIGTRIATKVLKDGDIIVINIEKGTVRKGK
ncbi:MAG: PEP-utilizing enzyme [Candidatus Woesearchaeota archaeon]